ncbi:uncharacterized protein [Spinacia oleracea]|uniref:Endonuclease/exonuclease/phosphatase domain-containing protein n=1 Tax=Spinacia oleracea TaxID=3562 RepID=A0ABM3QQM2_SPIOL|nr:uncharacterized protein LOC130461538 [Spinacia oleracea]
MYTQFIHCEVIDQQCVNCFFFTAVYELHTIDDRKSLLYDLGDISSAVDNSPWLISGDFNAIMGLRDKVNGGIVTLAKIKDFSEFVDSYQFYELQSKGHFYSWHKGGDITKTASRIDRCLEPHVGGRPFRFLNYLVDHDDFLPSVEHCSGSVMLLVWEKLKLVKLKLKTLHKLEFQGISSKIDQARLQLDSIQNQLQQNHSDSFLLSQEHICSAELRKRLRIEEVALRQKSRLQWLKVGDSNSRFFFAAVKERNRVNRITELIDDNSNKLVKPADIQGEVLKFYG